MRSRKGRLLVLLPGFSVAAVLVALFVAAIPRTAIGVRIRGGPTEGSPVLSWRVELLEVGNVERVAADRHVSLLWALANGERGTIEATLDDEGARNVTFAPGTGAVAGPVHVKVYTSGVKGPIVDAAVRLTNAAWTSGAHRVRDRAAERSSFHVYVDESEMLRERLWWTAQGRCYSCRLVVETSPARKRAYVALVNRQGRLAGATVDLINGIGTLWLPDFTNDDPVWAVVSSSPTLGAPDRVSWPVNPRSVAGSATTFDVPDALLFDNVSETAALLRSRAQRFIVSAALLPLINAAVVLIVVSRRARSLQRRFDEALASEGN